MLNQDAKDILNAGIKVGEAMADGIQFSDITALMSISSAIAGWKKGIDSLLATMDESPMEIFEFVEDEFDLDNEVLEVQVEKTIGWLASTYELYTTWFNREESEDKEVLDREE